MKKYVCVCVVQKLFQQSLTLITNENENENYSQFYSKQKLKKQNKTEIF